MLGILWYDLVYFRLPSLLYLLVSGVAKRQDSDAERMLEETVYSHSRKSGENKRYKMRTLPRRKKSFLI